MPSTITVIQDPGYTSSLHTPMWHVVLSSNFGQPNFRYVFDLYVGTAAGSFFVIRLKVFPDSIGRGTIDVSRIVRGYLANYFSPDNTSYPPLVMNTYNNAVYYGIDYREEYNVSGVTTLSAVQLTAFYTGINAYNTDTPTSGNPYAPYLGYDYAWLTSRRLDAALVNRTSSSYLSFNNTAFATIGPPNLISIAPVNYLRLQLLDSDGNPTGATYDTTALPSLAAFSKGLLVLNLNPASVNAAPWVSAPTPVIPATAEGYRVRMRTAYPIGGGATVTTLSAWVYVRFLCEAKAKATPIHFMNRFGGFDTFFFTGPTRKEMETDRKSFQRIPMVTRSNVLREYDSLNNVFADTNIQYATKQSWTRSLNSGYLSDTDHLWLAELLTSPQVYLEEGGYYFPVTIKTGKWSQKLTRFDKMYNLELEIIMGRQVVSQSR